MIDLIDVWVNPFLESSHYSSGFSREVRTLIRVRDLGSWNSVLDGTSDDLVGLAGAVDVGGDEGMVHLFDRKKDVSELVCSSVEYDFDMASRGEDSITNLNGFNGGRGDFSHGCPL